MFVQTYDIVYLQTALIQIKEFHAHSLKNINKNMREFRDFKLKALIKAILSAHEEMSGLFRKKWVASSDTMFPISNIHGNLKPSNIFIENAGQNTNYEPVVIFSDRVTLSKPTND